MRSKGMTIFREPREIRFDELELPDPGPDDAVIRPHYVGICRSDLELLDGDFDRWVKVDYPIVIGHEWSGQVVSVGENVKGVAPGEHVVGECLAGHERWFGLTFNGAGSEEFVAPARLLHRVPEGIAPKQAGMIEPFTIAYRAVLLNAPCDGSDVVAIVGGGMIGQCAQVVARACGATTVVVEPSPSRRETASAMGADAVLDPIGVDDVGAALRDLSGTDGATLVIEASGSAAGIASTYVLAGHGGRITNVGVCPDPSIAAPLALIQAKDLTIRGMTGSPGVWPRAIRFLARHEIDLSPLASHEFEFAQVREAVETARDPSETLKVLLRPGGQLVDKALPTAVA